MSAVFDFVHQRLDRLSSKRKLEDYAPTDDDDDDDDVLEGGFSSDLLSVRMRKHEPNALPSNSTTSIAPPHHKQPHLEPRFSNAPSGPSLSWIHSLSRLQFFVKIASGGNTLVLHANSEDSVKSVHERIEAITKIPLIEQRLIYRGRQLQWEQSLAECSIENDAGLQLVGRLLSTHHPQAWQVIEDMVWLLCRMSKGEFPHSSGFVQSRLMAFLAMTPKDNSDATAGHLQTFSSASAPAALVMLYLSPHKGNKECADGLIRQFVSSIQTMLPKELHALCAPLMLEFCKLLLGATRDDPLYSFCRTTLGSMLEHISIGRGSENTYSSKELIVVKEIFPFVRELAKRLSLDLVSSMESPMTLGPSSNDVHDLTAFLLPIRTAITELVGVGAEIPIQLAEDSFSIPFYGEEINFLHGIFTGLMEKMEQCLQKMEDYLGMREKREVEHLRLGWSQYLAILRELNTLSKFYQGAQDRFWSILRQRKVSVCYLIVTYAKRCDDHKWLLEHKEVTDFESRRHLALLMLPELKDDYEEVHEMLIDRSHLLAESFEYIGRAEPEGLRSGLFMEFKNEEATGPGVLREWFLLVCQEIFNPQNALFIACPNDRRRFFPNPASKVDPLHLEYFSFSGRVIALALMHKVQVGLVLDRVFFLQLAGKYVSLEDIHDADPCLYSSCKKILEMDAEMVDSDALGLTFVLEVEQLGHRKIVELCPGGKNVAVNSQNREDYVDLLIQHRFVTSISEQVARFAQGFSDILCNSELQKFFQSLELEDLDWMLHGSESVISIEDWMAHTEYNGYKETDPQILWFWKMLGHAWQENRRPLLARCRGSSRHHEILDH
ncbi:E3 ubiquitin-protein ligase UPL5 isoform X2 [Diospyros lotus]|uniref:E3 ubiquitin-protein ligase UPL5 isoform X2 n=1 Tax=Diospyros lotus TaxID=55363 RepID=UPI0022541EC1|nr:E3 ubiquitin-protein ligase UPL5 isoform X2 [Diospyros lotus]XP_052203230.1 E3 ubiquitin-protein ligase UPL5 isoform X2 [Diospyros lotus]